MDNYAFFEKNKNKEFDLSYGLVFINVEDRMNEFIDK